MISSQVININHHVIDMLDIRHVLDVKLAQEAVIRGAYSGYINSRKLNNSV